MKKSSGSPTRMIERETPGPARPVPVQAAKGQGTWTGYLAAGAAIVILILMILPCRYRTCSGDRERISDGFSWIHSGIHRAGVEKRPVLTARRPAPRRTIIPADRTERKDTGGTNEKGTVNPPDKPKVYDFGTKLELITEPETR